MYVGCGEGGLVMGYDFGGFGVGEGGFEVGLMGFGLGGGYGIVFCRLKKFRFWCCFVCGY